MDFELTTIIPLALAMLTTGVAAGILAGLLGVGGGIVIVPVLFNLFDLIGIPPEIRMHLAVGTSLATIIPTSISSARAHHRRGSVDVALLKSWGVTIFVGVLIGTAVASVVNGEVLTGVFGILALAVAYNMAFKKDGWSITDHLPTGWIKHLIALFIGGFSAMMGIGGGTFSVPVLSACSYPIRKAVGTASAIGLIIAVPGAVGFVLSGWGNPSLPMGSIGYVNLIGFACIVPATILSAPVGAKIAHTISTGGLRKAFALFLFLTALRMLYSLIA